MKEKDKIKKGHWFNVIIFFLILKAIISFYSVVTFFGDPNVPKILFESPKILWVWYFFIGPLIFTVFPLILALLLYKRVYYKACKVLSVIVCFGPPWGTALGIFTLVLLRRDSIKLEFNYLQSSRNNDSANKAVAPDHRGRVS